MLKKLFVVKIKSKLNAFLKKIKIFFVKIDGANFNIELLFRVRCCNFLILHNKIIINCI